MTKTKFVIFIALTVITLLLFLVPKGIQYLKSQNPELLNTAESIKLQAGEYTVGKDIKVGIYDMQVTKGSLSYYSTRLSKGDEIIGINLLDANKLYFEGSGEVELTPAEFNPIKPSANIFTIQHSGSYEVGKQIPAGKYSLTYTIELIPLTKVVRKNLLFKYYHLILMTLVLKYNLKPNRHIILI